MRMTVDETARQQERLFINTFSLYICMPSVNASSCVCVYVHTIYCIIIIMIKKLSQTKYKQRRRRRTQFVSLSSFCMYTNRYKMALDWNNKLDFFKLVFIWLWLPHFSTYCALMMHFLVCCRRVVTPVYH